MIRRALLFSMLLLLSFISVHAQKRAFTIEDLYRVKNISDLHVSPDGKTLVFAVAISDLGRAKKTTHIWTMNIDGKNLRQLTTGETSESSPSFSPDGKQILFVSSKDGDNLYLMSSNPSLKRIVEAQERPKNQQGKPDVKPGP
jgi:Tol biopolymer transport system component